MLLLSGGSAVGIYEELARRLKLNIEPGQLVVGLVDERYDPNPNHIDTNDTAIRNSGIITRLEQLGAIYSPILHGKSLEEEAAQYEYQLTQYLIHEQRQLITVLGIGPDSHIAGILPDADSGRFSTRFDSQNLVVGYRNDSQYPQRITLTLPVLRLSDETIVLIKDISKLPLLRRLTDNQLQLSTHDIPANIIRELKQVIIATPSEEKKI